MLSLSGGYRHGPLSPPHPGPAGQRGRMLSDLWQVVGMRVSASQHRASSTVLLASAFPRFSFVFPPTSSFFFSLVVCLGGVVLVLVFI